MHVLNLVTNEESTCYRQQMTTLESMGVTCTTLSVPGYSEWSEEGRHHREIADYLRFVPTVFRRSFGDYDLIHVNYGLTGPAALAQPNLPVVLGLWGSDLYGKFGAIGRLSAHFSDEVVVMSERMAQDLGQDCHVIPHGVNLDRFAPQPQDEARAQLGWDDRRHVLFPYPPTREVKDFPRAQRIVDTVGEQLDDDVELHSTTGVPHDQMSVRMNAADAMLLTSTHEGSPNATKEALACNLPIVSVDVGDVDEQVAGVSHSHVCQTDRDLVASLTDVLRAGERSDGRERAREYGLERTGTQLISVYESLLA